tara:strand:- start:9472 stop:10113 length:642 start_codon:yes stop_codon:yes gene_type:complete
MSSILDNAEKSTVTSNSVLEKLKSLSSNLSKNASEEVNNISSTVTNESINISNESTSSKIFNIFRYVLVILLICFALLNILAVFDVLSPTLVKLFSPILFSLNYSEYKKPKQVEKQPVTLKDKTEKQKNDKISTIDAIEKDIEKDVKDLKDLVVPNSDLASSDIQSQKSKAGYCYVGEDRGYRSCVQVKESDKCMSGDIFPTNDICVNPSLRA